MLEFTAYVVATVLLDRFAVEVGKAGTVVVMVDWMVKTVVITLGAVRVVVEPEVAKV